MYAVPGITLYVAPMTLLATPATVRAGMSNPKVLPRRKALLQYTLATIYYPIVCWGRQFAWHSERDNDIPYTSGPIIPILLEIYSL